MRRWQLALGFLGSVLMVAGTVLPWMTFYAGLDTKSGLSGLYGRLLLAAGVALLGLVVVSARRPGALVRGLIAALALTSATTAAVLLSRALDLTETPAMLMLVPKVGPGLAFVLAGATLALVAAIPRRTVAVETVRADS